jgi:gamma-glutamylcyclotransferase
MIFGNSRSKSNRKEQTMTKRKTKIRDWQDAINWYNDLHDDAGEAPFTGTAEWYWAYGSNLDHSQMANRCPAAKPFAPLYLDNGALVFRGIADVVTREGSQIAGGLWQITPACERALDTYEGVAGKLYSKEYLTLRIGKKTVKCLYYKMVRKGSSPLGVSPPWEGYLNGIIQGYKDFGLDLTLLNAALEHSWSNKNKTEAIKRRYINRKITGSLPRSLGVD